MIITTCTLILLLAGIQALPVTNDVSIQCNMKVEKHNIEVQCDLLSSQDVECCDLSSADDDIDSNGSCMSQEELKWINHMKKP